MNRSEIKLCMFDMGGVVAPHDDTALELRLLRDFGVENVDSFEELNPLLVPVMLEHSRGDITESEFWNRFSSISGITVPEYGGSLWGKYFDPSFDPTVVSVIQDLKKIGMRVVCGTNTEPAHYAIHQARGHYDIFDQVYSSTDLHAVKPETAFYEKILAYERIPADQVFYTDDYESYCQGGASCGLRAFLFRGADTLRLQLRELQLL